MEFDVIDITPEEVKELSVIQMKMLRTAQQKKNELSRKAQKEIESFMLMAMSSGMTGSTLISDKKAQVEEELRYQSAILADNLLYNMSLNEPTSGGDIGGEESDESAGYIVDYSLPYYDRYAIVRDYYFTIEDPAERLALYTKDEVAKRYLSNYYNALFNVIYSYSL